MFDKKPEISEADLAKRWKTKREAIGILSNNIHKLRAATTRDLQSDNEKEALTALCIKVIDITGERIGNDTSANEAGHHGISDINKSHISISGNSVALNYVGKSGVEHETKFSNESVAKALKKAIKNSPSKKVFVTSDGFEIPPSRINNYLSQFDISAKSLRGYKCNKMVIDKLRETASESYHSDEKKRKKHFLKILTQVAAKIGHTRSILRKDYLLPELEKSYVEKGELIQLSDVYKDGGSIPSDTFCIFELFETIGIW